jgi:glycosyltransferase involved in cell wall biosynthesis
MLPSVSVVMAAFDAERFVGEAIERALAQDHPAGLVEVIVVGDGSTDRTAAIAHRHARASGRVRVVGRPNGGNVAATNTGLAHAEGDVVALLDANDAWPRERLRRRARTLYRFHGANMSLGLQGLARRGELVKAAGFQRRLLRALRPGDAAAVEVAAGWGAFERNVREASALGDSPFRRVVEVTDADRAEAVALERAAGPALAAADAALALWPLVRAAAADPWNDAARDGLVLALAAA